MVSYVNKAMLNIQRGLLKSFQPDPLGMSRKYQMFGQVENFSADPCNFLYIMVEILNYCCELFGYV